MNHRSCVGLLYGIFLFIPINQVKSQITPAINAGSSLYSDNPNYQTAHQNHPWWVNLGAGPAFVGNTFAMNAGMVYCYQFDRSIISARILGVTNYNPTVQEIDKSYTIYKMAEYGILYGPIWQTNRRLSLCWCRHWIGTRSIRDSNRHCDKYKHQCTD